MTEEQLQGRLLGQDGDLDGVKAAELAMPRGEKDAAGERRGATFEPNGAVKQDGGV